MATGIILFVIVIVALATIFGNLTSQAGMNTAVQNIQASVVTMVYSGELIEIQQIVNEFVQLKEMGSSIEAEKFAEKLDERVNSLGLVKMYCQQGISTLELAFKQNPYEKVQQICPALKDISFAKAVELFRMM